MPLFCKTCKSNDRYLSFCIYTKIVCMLLRLINFCWIVLIWANLWPFSRADKLHHWFVVKNWRLKVVLYMMVLQWFRRRIFWCLILHHFCYFTQNWFVLRSTFYHVALTFRSGFSLGGLLFDNLCHTSDSNCDFEDDISLKKWVTVYDNNSW